MSILEIHDNNFEVEDKDIVSVVNIFYPTEKIINSVLEYDFPNLDYVQLDAIEILYGYRNNPINYVLQTLIKFIPRKNYDYISIKIDMGDVTNTDKFEGSALLVKFGGHDLYIKANTNDLLSLTIPEPLRFEKVFINIATHLHAKLFFKDDLLRNIVIDKMEKIKNINRLDLEITLVSNDEPNFFDKMFKLLESIKESKIKIIIIEILVLKDSNIKYSDYQNEQYEIDHYSSKIRFVYKKKCPNIDITFFFEKNIYEKLRLNKYHTYEEYEEYDD